VSSVSQSVANPLVINTLLHLGQLVSRYVSLAGWGFLAFFGFLGTWLSAWVKKCSFGIAPEAVRRQLWRFGDLKLRHSSAFFIQGVQAYRSNATKSIASINKKDILTN